MRRLFFGIAITLGVFVPTAVQGAATKGNPEWSLKHLTQRSESVVIGECTDKRVYWTGKHFETEYDVKVKEKLKGGKHREAGQQLQVRTLGGEATSPPLAQYVPMQPYMYKGEQVLLFLSERPIDTTKKAPDGVSKKYIQGPRVTAWGQGKFTIFHDGQGKQKVARVNTEDYGYAHHDVLLQRVVRAMATGKMKTTPGQVVRSGDEPSLTPKETAVLDHLTTSLKMRGKDFKGSSSQASQRLQRANAPAVQDLEDFKSQVRQFVN